MLALVTGASGWAQPPAREQLNSERIAEAFGSYGVEVLEQDGDVRVSNLYSLDGAQRTSRTFAIVLYAATDPAVSGEHAEILAGGSIGAVFAARGWEVRKTHLRYAETQASRQLASLMRVDVGTTLAQHAYVLDVMKSGRTIEYAALVEIHHPDYLQLEDLAAIYGPVADGRAGLLQRLLAVAADRAR